jgi:hypothetical protein
MFVRLWDRLGTKYMTPNSYAISTTFYCEGEER